MKLTGKIFIKGKIVAETGLHIGGSKSSLDIGGIDLNVIKTARGIPFIPGSSLKGKLRSMLARIDGSEKPDKDSDLIKAIFGDAGKGDDKNTVTRLLVRDANLDKDKFETEFAGVELEMDYTESKWENTINRKTGTAEHPRQLERVPSGAEFNFEMVYDHYDDGNTKDHLTHIRTAMRLLEGDYLGGSGSRGYGKVKFKDVVCEIKEVADFQNGNTKKAYSDFKFDF
jgi:CRISPR-associated protein Csm3